MGAGVLVLAAGCGSPTASDSNGGPGGAAEPLRIGLVYSKTGPLASYGQQYRQGFDAGLDYVTDGSGAVGARRVQIVERDDAGDPAKAVSAAKELIGDGVRILAGSTSSGVALQVAPLAAQNKVLFISGPAATDAITGINDYTFRSGRQTYQDILTAADFIGDPGGKKVVVFAQDSAFGQANVAAVTAVLGAKGATVDKLLVPTSATDFAPFAQRAKAAKADLLFVAWAGTTATAMWQALGQQGAFSGSTVVTGLDQRASYPTFGAVGSQINFLSHFFAEAVDNDVSKAMAKAVQANGGTVDLFTPDGFAAAQMIVHAVDKAGGDDPTALVQALEGWSFSGPKGPMTVRAEDHALLQPMFQARLRGSGTSLAPELVKTLPPAAVAPPVAKS